MDYKFDINQVLPYKINKITPSLIAPNDRGYNDSNQKLIIRILDDIGEDSAKAQGLNRTITSGAKLRDTDHIVYLLVDKTGNNGLGSVVGLLKTGSKSLFMFDENGLHYQLRPRCILDFYIHQSRQRMGYGNELYKFMLAEEQLEPIKLAIDRPSDKFLAFLEKHYGLKAVIPQNNKFVVFQGFFDDENQMPNTNRQSTNIYSYSNMSSPNISAECHVNSNSFVNAHSPRFSINGTPKTRSAYGRYAATRPVCSMANIIHNTSADDQPAEQIRPVTADGKVESAEQRPDSLSLCNEDVVDDDGVNKETGDLPLDNEVVELDEEEAPQPPMEKLTLQDVPDASRPEPLDPDDDDDDDDLPSETVNESKRNASPLCSQEVAVENQQLSAGHLDLKFYHSPLW